MRKRLGKGMRRDYKTGWDRNIPRPHPPETRPLAACDLNEMARRIVQREDEVSSGNGLPTRAGSAHVPSRSDLGTSRAS